MLAARPRARAGSSPGRSASPARSGRRASCGQARGRRRHAGRALPPALGLFPARPAARRRRAACRCGRCGAIPAGARIRRAAITTARSARPRATPPTGCGAQDGLYDLVFVLDQNFTAAGEGQGQRGVLPHRPSRSCRRPPAASRFRLRRCGGSRRVCRARRSGRRIKKPPRRGGSSRAARGGDALRMGYGGTILHRARSGAIGSRLAEFAVRRRP